MEFAALIGYGVYRWHYFRAKNWVDAARKAQKMCKKGQKVAELHWNQEDSNG